MVQAALKDDDLNPGKPLTYDERKAIERRVRRADAMMNSIKRLVRSNEDLEPRQWRELHRTTTRQIQRYLDDYGRDANPILEHASTIPIKSGGPYLSAFLYVVNADNLFLREVWLDQNRLDVAPNKEAGRPSYKDQDGIARSLLVMEYGLLAFGSGWEKREARAHEIARVLGKFGVHKSEAWVSRHLATSDPITSVRPSLDWVEKYHERVMKCDVEF